MASPLPKSPGIVYRRGSASPDNFTPRPGKDTAGGSVRAPGLSTFETLDLEPGEKVQVIDLGQLGLPLRGVPDDPRHGGVEAHVSIVPFESSGNIDWAAARGTGRIHALTQLVRGAIVNEVRGK